MVKKLNLVGKRFGKLTVLKLASINEYTVWECLCDCGRTVNVKGVYLTTGQTKSCGCLKKEIDQKNLREKYDEKRVDGVMIPLFKDKKPRKDSTTGYRGVTKYYTRKSKEQRYRAWITVNGKSYYKSGFKTPEEAYYKGRLELEKEHLPRKDEQ